MKKLLAVLLVVALPAFAEETCAELATKGVTDVTGESVCLEQGEPAPFRARALSFPEHLRREKVNERNADLWEGVTHGDVVVVSKPALYTLIAGSTASVVALIVLGGLAAAHKL